MNNNLEMGDDIRFDRRNHATIETETPVTSPLTDSPYVSPFSSSSGQKRSYEEMLPSTNIFTILIDHQR